MNLRTCIVGAAVMIGAVLGTGCFGGGGDGQTLEEYFAAYERLDNAAEARTEQLQKDYAEVLGSTTVNEETRTGLQEYVTKLVAARQTYLDGISELEAPEEAAEAHAESVAAYEAVLTAYEPIAGEIATVTSIAELQRVFEAPALTEAIARSDESCRVLQAVADGAGINANLECPATNG